MKQNLIQIFESVSEDSDYIVMKYSNGSGMMDDPLEIHHLQINIDDLPDIAFALNKMYAKVSGK